MIRVCCDGPVVPSEWLDAVYHENRGDKKRFDRITGSTG